MILLVIKLARYRLCRGKLNSFFATTITACMMDGLCNNGREIENIFLEIQSYLNV